MKNSFLDTISILLLSVIFLMIGYMIYASKSGIFKEHPHWVYSVDINNQNCIASVSNNEIFLWNKRQCTNILSGHNDAIKNIRFSHNGQLLVTGSIDRTAKIWSLQTKQNIKTFKSHSKGINKVDFSVNDKYLVSAGYDDKLFIWDWKNDKIINEFNIKHTYFSINKSDILAYIDTTCSLILYDLKSLQPIKTLGKYCGAPLFHPDKNILAVGDINSSTFTFIDINSGKVISNLDIKKKNSSSEVSVFEFTPDGNYIAAGIWGGDIEIWDWQNKKLTRTLNENSMNLIEDFSFSKENDLVSASGDGTVKIWDWENNNLKMVIGDSSYERKLGGILSMIIVLTLVISFWVIIKRTEYKFSAFSILTILTLWSLGTLFILYYFKTYLIKFAKIISWTTSILSGLFLLSGWFAGLALLTIPIALFFGYLQIRFDRKNKSAILPTIVNLVYCVIFCALIISASFF